MAVVERLIMNDGATRVGFRYDDADNRLASFFAVNAYPDRRCVLNVHTPQREVFESRTILPGETWNAPVRVDRFLEPDERNPASIWFGRGWGVSLSWEKTTPRRGR